MRLISLSALFSPQSVNSLHGVSAAATECFFYYRDLELQSPLMPLPYCTSTLLWLLLMTFFVSPSQCIASLRPLPPPVWKEECSCVAFKGGGGGGGRGGEAMKGTADSFSFSFSLILAGPWDVWSQFSGCWTAYISGHGWRVYMHMYESDGIYMRAFCVCLCGSGRVQSHWQDKLGLIVCLCVRLCVCTSRQISCQKSTDLPRIPNTPAPSLQPLLPPCHHFVCVYLPINHSRLHLFYPSVSFSISTHTHTYLYQQQDFFFFSLVIAKG